MSAQDNFDIFSSQIQPVRTPAASTSKAMLATQAVVQQPGIPMDPQFANQVSFRPQLPSPILASYPPLPGSSSPLIVFGESMQALPGVIPPFRTHKGRSGRVGLGGHHAFPLVILGETMDALPGINPETGMSEVGPGLVIFKPADQVDCNNVKEKIAELLSAGDVRGATMLFDKFLPICPKKLVSLWKTRGPLDIDTGGTIEGLLSDWDCRARLAVASSAFVRVFPIDPTLTPEQVFQHLLENWEEISSALTTIDVARCLSQASSAAVVALRNLEDPKADDSPEDKSKKVKAVQALWDELDKDRVRGKGRK